MFKKVLSVFMAAAMLLSFAGVFAYAQEPAAASSLQFDSNGEFKILVFADCQDAYPMQEAMLQYMNEVLDDVRPDIVVFDGDNVVSPDVRGFEQLLSPLTSRGIPFTFVFGNHDWESAQDPANNYTPTKEDLLAEYRKYDGCLAYDADPSLHGCATHNLTVASSTDPDKVAFNLWMFDSGDYATYADGSSGYDCVRRDQVEWYKNVSAQLERENGGKVPSIAFQHIITQEVCEKAFLKVPFGLGEITYNFSDGSHYLKVPQAYAFKGAAFEASCPSMDNEGQWDAFVERGDVLACVFGHDHINDFELDVNGVDALQSPAITYHSYSKNSNKGARLITVKENDPRNYETEILYIYDYALKDGSQIAGLSDCDKSYYVWGKIFHFIVYTFVDVMNIFSFLAK